MASLDSNFGSNSDQRHDAFQTAFHDPFVATLLPENLRRILAAHAAEDDGIAAQLEDLAIAADHRKSTALSRRRVLLARTLEPLSELLRASQGLRDLAEMQASGDAELVALAREERPVLTARARTLASDISKALVTGDDAGIASFMLEVRMGVGGDEAALWASNCLKSNLATLVDSRTRSVQSKVSARLLHFNSRAARIK